MASARDTNKHHRAEYTQEVGCETEKQLNIQCEYDESLLRHLNDKVFFYPPNMIKDQQVCEQGENAQMVGVCVCVCVILLLWSVFPVGVCVRVRVCV